MSESNFFSASSLLAVVPDWKHRCPGCKNKFRAGQKAWKFARIDPKNVTITFCYVCHTCTDKVSRGQKEIKALEDAGQSPTAKQIGKVWAGVMRLQRERGVANGACAGIPDAKKSYLHRK
jgi:hypothetical protein